MKKLITYSLGWITAVMLFVAVIPREAFAQKIARTSAVLSGQSIVTPKIVKRDKRAEILKAYLEKYDSPLAPHAQSFIDEADKHNIDWKIVPAITGVESYYGQMIPPYSYNGWGYGVYGNNVRRFTSWDEGISVVTTALRKEYMDARGAQNIYQIGSTYAADPNWANKVIRFINEIEAYKTRTEKPTLSITL